MKALENYINNDQQFNRHDFRWQFLSWLRYTYNNGAFVLLNSSRLLGRTHRFDLNTLLKRFL